MLTQKESRINKNVAKLFLLKTQTKFQRFRRKSKPLKLGLPININKKGQYNVSARY